MKMEQTECSETSAYKIQTPGNYPEENIQHTEHGKSLKSRTGFGCLCLMFQRIRASPSSRVKSSEMVLNCLTMKMGALGPSKCMELVTQQLSLTTKKT
jgi:hypothetical protein